MDRVFSSRWASPAAVLALAVSVLLAYSNTFHAAFQFDDLPTIVNNPALKNPGSIGPLFRGTRGVTYATFALNYAFGGLDPFGYHAVNTGIHIVNSALAYFLLLSTFNLLGWGAARARMIAVFSALLFALHPVQTQAVTYIVQRMESLSATFYLLSLLLFARSASAATFARRGALFVLTAAAYALGFYSKETAITLPAVALLYDYCFMAKGRAAEMLRRRWPAYAMLGALLAVFAVNTVAPMGGFGDLSEESAGAPAYIEQAVAPPSQGTTAGAKLTPAQATALSAGFGLKSITPRQYLYTQFNVLTYYFALLLVPMNQNLDYDFPVAGSLFAAPRTNPGTALTLPMLPPAVSLAVLVFIIGLGVWFIARTRERHGSPRRVAAFFIFWFFIILSPTSSIVPIADVIYEHRVYLPSLGFFAIFTLCVEAAFARLLKGRGA